MKKERKNMKKKDKNVENLKKKKLGIEKNETKIKMKKINQKSNQIMFKLKKNLLINLKEKD